jgi:flotillin
MTLIAVLVGIVALFLIVLSVIVSRLLYICSPNEVLIFSGGQRASQGRSVGYRVIKGGRAVRIPLLEAVDRMDLTNMPIEVSVQGAYSKGGIPLNVHGIANLKIAGEPPVLDNAVERFLGVDRKQIMMVAKEALEGNLRGVLATLTPEEINQDKIKFAQSLLTEAEDDLRRIGIELDTLKIQDVNDEVGYLDSIGRRQSAEVQKTALIAEARSKAESAVQAARNPPRHRAVPPGRAACHLQGRQRPPAHRRRDPHLCGGGRGQGRGGLEAGPRRGRRGGAEGPRRAGAPPDAGRRPRAGPRPQGGRRGQRQGRRRPDHRAGARHRRGHGRDRAVLASGGR